MSYKDFIEDSEWSYVFHRFKSYYGIIIFEPGKDSIEETYLELIEGLEEYDSYNYNIDLKHMKDTVEFRKFMTEVEEVLIDIIDGNLPYNEKAASDLLHYILNKYFFIRRALPNCIDEYLKFFPSLDLFRDLLTKYKFVDVDQLENILGPVDELHEDFIKYVFDIYQECLNDRLPNRILRDNIKLLTSNLQDIPKHPTITRDDILNQGWIGPYLCKLTKNDLKTVLINSSHFIYTDELNKLKLTNTDIYEINKFRLYRDPATFIYNATQEDNWNLLINSGLLTHFHRYNLNEAKLKHYEEIYHYYKHRDLVNFIIPSTTVKKRNYYVDLYSKEIIGNSVIRLFEIYNDIPYEEEKYLLDNQITDFANISDMFIFRYEKFYSGLMDIYNLYSFCNWFSFRTTTSDINKSNKLLSKWLSRLSKYPILFQELLKSYIYDFGSENLVDLFITKDYISDLNEESQKIVTNLIMKNF